jgi:hypothetical protein
MNPRVSYRASLCSRDLIVTAYLCCGRSTYCTLVTLATYLPTLPICGFYLGPLWGQRHHWKNRPKIAWIGT